MFQPRGYQIKAIESLANADLGYIVARAGSGKSAVMAFAVKMREARECKPMSVCVLVPTQEIKTQMLKTFAAVGTLGPVQAHCWQGLDRVPDCDILIIDEAHGAGAPCYRRLLRTTLVQQGGKWVRRCITWACTATPRREDGEPIEPIIGPCLYTVPESAIKAAGGVLPGRVQIVRYHDSDIKAQCEEAALKAAREYVKKVGVKKFYANFASRFYGISHYGAAMVFRSKLDEEARVEFDAAAKKKILAEKSYSFLMDQAITNSKKRNCFVAGIIRQHILAGASVIALADTIEQCAAIADMAGPGTAPFHARLGKRERERVLAEFKAGILKCIVATSVADEGMDCPIANVLIMARASKAAGRTEQRAGRVMRPYPGKAYGLVVDVFDTSHGMLAGQHHKRKRLYSEWGFSIEKGL
jgi:superfamily II DNA or RNA helicase